VGREKATTRRSYSRIRLIGHDSYGTSGTPRRRGTGYDNRTAGGVGNIQLVTPSLTHWLSPSWNSHTAQVGMLKIQVPEPGAVLLLAAGGGVLGLLYWTSRRV
jgi:hypothetical protein